MKRKQSYITLTALDVAEHVRQLLEEWDEFEELTTKRLEAKLITKRRNGQRFKIIVKELEE